MNAQIFYRYCWQLPMLVLLCLVLVPDLPWWHPAIGFWPLWLLAMPVLTLVRSGRAAHRGVSSARNSQVLVFPAPRKPAGGVSRKAA